MKKLREELLQPEAYLRETLEKIAVLAKSGPFATTWSLKPENQLANYQGADSIAPTGEDESDLNMDDDDEDEDVKFEDVVPS
jgi:transcription initiation factor TFIIF subunit beta